MRSLQYKQCIRKFHKFENLPYHIASWKGGCHMKTASILVIHVIYISILTLVSCSHTIPPDPGKPQPPAQLGSSPPAIPPVSADTQQTRAPESTLPVSVTADLSPLVRIIHAALPERFTEEDHPLGYDYMWRFVREGEPNVQILDGIVKYRATYRGEIEQPAPRACRLDPLYPVIEGTGRLSFQEQEQGLLVTLSDPRTTIDLKPESDSSCNMFKIPVKDQLAEILDRDALTRRFSQSVDHAAYILPLGLVWERLQQPISIGQDNMQVCLYGQAQEFIVGSMKGSADRTTITSVTKQTPVALNQTPCPPFKAASPMKIHMDRSIVSTQDGQPYKILLTVPVPYTLLSQQLQQRLFHQEVKLPNLWGDNLLIERVTASNGNGRTLLSINTSGNVNGTFYYWGVPRLEQDGNVISLSDIEMAAESKAALDQIKPGYWKMVDLELKPRLQKAALVDLSPQMGTVRSALSAQHKSGWLQLDLLVARQEAGQVISTQNALMTEVVLEGAASATGQLPIEQRLQGVQQQDGSPDEATPGLAIQH